MITNATKLFKLEGNLDGRGFRDWTLTTSTGLAVALADGEAEYLRASRTGTNDFDTRAAKVFGINPHAIDKPEIVNGQRIECYKLDGDENERDPWTVVYLDQHERHGLVAMVGLSGHTSGHAGPNLGRRVLFADLPVQLLRTVEDDTLEMESVSAVLVLDESGLIPTAEGRATLRKLREGLAAGHFISEPIPGTAAVAHYPRSRSQRMLAADFTRMNLDGATTAPVGAGYPETVDDVLGSASADQLRHVVAVLLHRLHVAKR